MSVSQWVTNKNALNCKICQGCNVNDLQRSLKVMCGPVTGWGKKSRVKCQKWHQEWQVKSEMSKVTSRVKSKEGQVKSDILEWFVVSII